MEQGAKKKTSIFLIMIIISMPLSISSVFADFSSQLSDTENIITDFDLGDDSLEVITGDVIEGFEESKRELELLNEQIQNDNGGLDEVTGYITIQNKPSDFTDKCLERGNKTSSIVETLDNEIIDTLEKVIAMMNLICTAMTSIHSIYSTFKLFLGSCKDGTCKGEPYTCGACSADDVFYGWWGETYKTVFQPLCCFINCGWCTGQGCGILGEDIEDAVKDSDWGVWGEDGYVDEFNIGPYDNIYSATACLCPGAILFNVRKLKTVYQTYNCCIEQACEYGLPTEVCEKQLSHDTCMYWEGSIYLMVTDWISDWLAEKIAGYLMELVAEYAAEWAISTTALAILELAKIPGMIQSVIDAYDWFSTSFDEPKCEDLGFAEIAEKKANQVKETNSRAAEKYTVNSDGTKFLNQGFLNPDGRPNFDISKEERLEDLNEAREKADSDEDKERYDKEIEELQKQINDDKASEPEEFDENLFHLKGGDSDLDEYFEDQENEKIKNQMEDSLDSFIKDILNEFAYDQVSSYCTDQWESSNSTI